MCCAQSEVKMQQLQAAGHLALVACAGTMCDKALAVAVELMHLALCAFLSMVLQYRTQAGTEKHSALWDESNSSLQLLLFQGAKCLFVPACVLSTCTRVQPSACAESARFFVRTQMSSLSG
jgi:hypothetical protein